jgi:Fe-S oxidoreductase
MTPNREHTYCCGAGGGGIRMWPDSTDPENIRMNVSAFKAEQIRQTGVSAVVTPCATCWRSLDQIVEHHNVPAKTDMLMMLVYRAMMAALSRKAVQEPEPAVALAA